MCRHLGTKLIDAIEVTEPGPELKDGQRYLIYVLLNPSGVGILAHGDTGISAVGDNGQLIPFRKGFEQGDSLEALKSKLASQLFISTSRILVSPRSGLADHDRRFAIT